MDESTNIQIYEKNNEKQSSDVGHNRNGALNALHVLFFDRSLAMFIPLAVLFLAIILTLLTFERLVPAFLSMPIAILLIACSIYSLIGIPLRVCYVYLYGKNKAKRH